MMPRTQTYGARMNSVLLNYYEAIEKASQGGTAGS